MEKGIWRKHKAKGGAATHQQTDPALHLPNRPGVISSKPPWRYIFQTALALHFAG
jgi:hypothetical protein